MQASAGVSLAAIDAHGRLGRGLIVMDIGVSDASVRLGHQQLRVMAALGLDLLLFDDREDVHGNLHRKSASPLPGADRTAPLGANVYSTYVVSVTTATFLRSLHTLAVLQHGATFPQQI